AIIPSSEDGAGPPEDDAGLASDVLAPAGPLAYSPCSISERVGGFEITLAEDYTGVNGQVANGVVPGNVPEVVADAGDCALLQASALFCDPPCVPGETCGADGACIPYPENQTVGPVTVEGLKSPLVMEAKWGNYYTNPGTMEHPGYETGAELTLSAEGGDLQPFAARGLGVSPLQVTGGTVSVEDQEDVLVTWIPGEDQEAVRVHLELNINNHGTTSAWIACDVDDTGSALIPADLVSGLYAIGVSGFPSLEAERRSVESAQLSVGCVEFEVVSPASVPVEVGGVVSCTSDVQCPPGQSCGVDLQCQ
ncbi:MAG: hypothetical protein VX938_07210, partial [Myxococcota bacterium]|nr:hypothetical protein [Myxococcota bacterium]